MLEFINRHIKLILGIGIAIILAMVIVLVYVNYNRTVVQETIVSNESQYEFLQSSIPEQDKYLMLLAKIHAENYGTFTLSDPRPLWDLKNQATTNFQAKVDELLNSISDQDNFSTTVDPDTIKIIRQDAQSAEIDMEAVQVVGMAQRNITLVLYFKKENSYWLVDNIITSER